MPRKATIGPEVYERVNALVAEGKSRTEAFQQIGEERGSRPGTVAANYYRTARSQGKTGSARSSTRTRRRRPRTATSASTRRPRNTAARPAATQQNGDIGQLAQQIAELTERLVRQIQERDEQLRKLLG